MGLIDRLRARRTKREDAAQAASHVAPRLHGFIAERAGVEAWLEAPTNFNSPSILLVAGDGEWLRCEIPSLPWGADWCERQHLVWHKAGQVPYPQRMRDFNARQRRG